jgi:hypothetical protein
MLSQKVDTCFASATTNVYPSYNRNRLVNEIVDFVDDYNLDGIDIDWEYPNNTTTNYTEWYQYVALLQELKAKLPGKRISVALFRYAPDWWFDPPFINIPAQIWSTVDAIHLMTYDQNVRSGWQGNHSDAASSNTAIDEWAAWGTSGGRNLDKKKLFVGCAFYGYNTKNSNLWDNDTKVSYSTYSAANFSGSPGDNTTSVATKVNHCLANGYGGVMIWVLGYDTNITTTPTLLDAVWNASNPPVLSGSTSVCGSGTYSISNLPAGITAIQVKWTCSSNLQLIGGIYGLNKTVNVISNGTGWIKAEIIPTNTVLQKNNITVKKFPSPTSTSVSTRYNQYVPIIPPDYTLNYQFECDSDGAGMHFMTDYGPATQVYISAPGSYTVYAYARSGCGSGQTPTHTVYITAGRSSSTQSNVEIYPNPVSDILYIDLDTSQRQSVSPAVSANSADYDLRLYDGQGNMLRQQQTKGGTVQFNVQNLPEGIYYLHIYDGVSATPEIRQIVVER